MQSIQSLLRHLSREQSARTDCSPDPHPWCCVTSMVKNSHPAVVFLRICVNAHMLRLRVSGNEITRSCQCPIPEMTLQYPVSRRLTVEHKQSRGQRDSQSAERDSWLKEDGDEHKREKKQEKETGGRNLTTRWEWYRHSVSAGTARK